MKVGSLCTGIAGLERGLELAGINTETVFVSDIDDGANTWLEANIDAPNLGDFTALDELPPVHVLTAGFPCQPVSFAGQRKGVDDDRWLFDDICRLVSRMETRPVVFLENVPGLLTANGGDAMARVVYGLASIGYSITWGTLSAVAVGAPHRRNRWWGVAWPPDSPPSDAFTTTSRVRNPTGEPSGRTGHAADTARSERRGPEQQDLPSPTGPAAESGERARSLTERFGPYAEAIGQWERVLGRTAPDPAVDGRISPAFVEWMMGYPKAG